MLRPSGAKRADHDAPIAKVTRRQIAPPPGSSGHAGTLGLGAAAGSSRGFDRGATLHTTSAATSAPPAAAASAIGHARRGVSATVATVGAVPAASELSPRGVSAPVSASSANARSLADWKRASGCFSRQRSTTATIGWGASSGAGEPQRIAACSSIAVSAANGRRPASISYSTTPSANRSARASTGRPTSCSGAMYAGVPIIAPTAVSGRAVFVRAGSALAHELGDAEVEELDATVDGDEQVVGLDVAVDDARPVRGGEPARDLGGDGERGAHRQRTAGEPRAQRLALEQLRDQVRHALGPPDVEHDEQVRMGDRADRARLLREPAEPLLVRAELGRQDLDGDGAADARIARSPHLAHATRAERCLDDVRAERCTGRDVHGAILASRGRGRRAGPLIRTSPTHASGPTSADSWLARDGAVTMETRCRRAGPLGCSMVSPGELGTGELICALLVCSSMRSSAAGSSSACCSPPSARAWPASPSLPLASRSLSVPASRSCCAPRSR